MSIGCAKTAAVFSVVFAGINVYQLLANFGDVREKARLFAEVIAETGGTGRLRLMRVLLYVVAPLIYLWTLLCAGLPVVFLIVAAIKFWVSSFLGTWTERRLLAGGEYRASDHARARADAAANIVLAGSAIWLVLAVWR